MRKTLAALSAGALLAALSGTLSPSIAGADPVSAGSASAFAATASVLGSEVLPPTPEAAAAVPPGEDDLQTLIDIPAGPLATSGTLIANAKAHTASDIDSVLTQEGSEQAVDGPYNATAVGRVEDLDVILDQPAPGTSVVAANAVTAEAVGVCSAGQVEYAANSEIVDLRIGGEVVPINTPIQDIIDGITEALEPLDPIVDVRRNETEVTADGASVNALHVIVLAAAEEGGAPGPLLDVIIGHAEVSGLTCGGGDLPECSDTEDNDGDGVIDAEDPGCHSDGDPNNPDSFDPNDDSEATECQDTVDNADPEDELADAADPGCHTDGDATNAASFDPHDNSEVDEGALGRTAAPAQDDGALARTGGGVPGGLGLTAALAGLAATGFLLRRRLAA